MNILPDIMRATLVQPVLLMLFAAAPSTAQTGLPLPAVPDSLRTPGKRAAYLMEHFWDEMDFRDTLRSRDERFMEQNLVNFMSLFPHAGTDDVQRSVTLLTGRAAADGKAFMMVADLAAKYLYEKESPMFSELYYTMFLDGIRSSAAGTASLRSRAAFLFDAIRRNFPGTVAADFQMVLRDGRRSSLAETPARTTVLLFYDPHCDGCMAAVRSLSGDSALRSLAESGKITVLAVYTEGDAAVWQRTKDTLPEWWTVGADTGGILHDDIYFLPSMPSLYLIGADRTVILKDASVEELLEAVSR